MAAFENVNDEVLNKVNLVYEIIFFISLCLKFLYEYERDDAERVMERDLGKIATRYVKGDFIFDFVPLLPLVWLDLGGKERLFYLIKIVRLINGFKVFSVPAIMQKIKYFAKKKMEKIIQDDPVEAENISVDNNKISALIYTNFIMKIFKLVIIILNISYFLGFFWYIFCDLTMEIFYDGHSDADSTFMTNFGIKDNSNFHNTVVLTYFSFTSLSTVGFGDYHPRSNSERLLCAFILLFGVAIFSYIMGNFIEMLSDWKTLEADLDDGDNLSKFFGLIKYFNGNMDLEVGLKKRIEDHFDNKWEFDRNQAIDDEHERNILL